MKILVVGGGNMGLTYAKGFLKGHIVNKDNLYILEKSQEKAESLRELNMGSVFGKPDIFIADSDIIILAVKPQDIDKLFDDIRSYINPQQVILSIMAGITLEQIQEGLGTPKVIRAMPNLPAVVGLGMSVFHSSEEVTRIELVMVQNLLSATGKTIYVDEESKIDAATAISGSGPAYVFYFMKTLMDAATEMGYTQAQAELLTYQTFKGAVDLYNKYDFSCEEWIQKVSSKGGTTEAAIKTFDALTVSKGFTEGILAAKRRAEEL